MIKRTRYLNKLLQYKDQPFIKIITGVRRCGKSTLLKAYRDELIKESNCIYINMELPEMHYLSHDTALLNFVLEQSPKTDKKLNLQ